MQNSPVNWQWKIDPNSDKLILCLANNIQFPTSFCRKQLCKLPSDKMPFTTDDAELYSAFRDELALTQLDQQAQFTIAINATAALCYLMPIATKSWFFQPLSTSLNAFTAGDVVETQSLEIGYYLVIDSEESTSTLLLLSTSQQVDIHRSFQQGQLIRVHNDRLEKKHNIEALVL